MGLGLGLGCGGQRVLVVRVSASVGGGVEGRAHVAVHDVELDPVDAGVLEPLALGAHVGPVGGEDLRWDAVV